MDERKITREDISKLLEKWNIDKDDEYEKNYELFRYVLENESLKKILVSLIKEKIESNKLKHVDKHMYDVIDENEELQQLILKKVKENGSFPDIEGLDFLLQYIFTDEYIEIYFNSLDIYDLIGIIYGGEFNGFVEELHRDEIPVSDKIYSIVERYKNEKREEAIQFIINKDYFGPIVDPQIIQYIVDHKVYSAAHVIKVSNPSQKIEDFIVESIDNIIIDKEKLYIYRYYTSSSKIKEAFFKHDIVELIMDALDPSNEEDVEFMLDALESDKVGYDNLPYLFTRKLEKNHIYISKKMLNGDYLTREDEEEIKNDLLLIKLITDIIKTQKNENDYRFNSLAYDVPEIALALIENYIKNDADSYFEGMSVDLLDKLYKENKEQLINSVIKLIESSPEKGKTIALHLAYKNNYPDLLNAVLYELNPDDLISLLYEFRYMDNYDEYIEIISNIIKERDIRFANLPENFELKEDYNYPRPIILLFYGSADERRLIKNSSNIIYSKDEELINTALKRIVELKLPFNKFYNSYSMELTPYFDELVNDPSNPLNLDFKYYYRYNNQINSENKAVFINYVCNTPKIDEGDIRTLIWWYSYSNEEEKQLISEVIQQMLEHGNFNPEHIYKAINDYNIFNDKNNNMSLIKSLEKFVKQRNDIPIYIAELYDEDVIKNNSLTNPDDELFENYSDRFKSSNPDSLKLLYEKLIEKLNSGKKVSIIYLLKISEVIDIDYKYLNHPNINSKYNQDSTLMNIIIKKCNNINDFNEFLKGILPIFKANELDYRVVFDILKKYKEFQSNILDDALINIISSQLNQFKINNYKEILTYCDNENFKELFKKCILNNSYTEIPVFMAEIYGFDIVNQYSIKNLKNVTIKKECINFKEFVETDNIEILNNMYKELSNRIEKGITINVLNLCYLISKGVKVDSKYFDYEFILDDLHELDQIHQFIVSNNDSITTLIGKQILKLENASSNIFNGIKENQLYKKYIIEAILNNNFKLEDTYDFNEYCFEPDILKAILAIGKIENIVSHYAHIGQKPEINEDIFKLMLPYIVNYYDIDRNNFVKLANEFGYEIIELLITDNFASVVNRSEEEIDKFIELFKERKLDRRMIEGINDSLRQNIFAKDNVDIMSIFPTMLAKIQDGIKEKDKLAYIEELVKYIPNDFDLEQVLINYYEGLDLRTEQIIQLKQGMSRELLTLFKTNKAEFLSRLFDFLAVDQDKYIPYLHAITSQYIHEKRNEYATDNDIFKDTNIKYVYDRKKVNDYFFNYLLKNDFQYLYIMVASNNPLAHDTLEYLLNPENFADNDKEYLIQLKKNIAVLKKSFYEKMDSYCREGEYVPAKYHFILEDENFQRQVKKEPIIPNVQNTSKQLEKILSKVKVDVLFDEVINNEEKYNKLMEIMDKYKLLSWGNLFDKSVEKLSFGTADDIYAFINAFDKIYDGEVKIINNEITVQISTLNKQLRLLFVEIEQMKSVGKSQEEIEAYINKKSKSLVNVYNKLLEETKTLVLGKEIEQMKNSGKSQEEVEAYINKKFQTLVNVYDKLLEDTEKLMLGKEIEESAREVAIQNKEKIEKYIEEEVAKNKDMTFNAYKILKYCSIYGGYANCFKVLIGIEDCELIKADPGPYKSHEETDVKFAKCARRQIQNIQKQDITIPSYIKDEPVGEDKYLRAIVGNRAAPFNLTHGERTEACMRAYGYADSLFDFTSLDSRGFHITFVDPKTGEYVSRVSGMRNGNTVFLNQLRHSVSNKFTTDEVIEACKQVAEQLIELSKDSEMPIENVVISSGYAMQKDYENKRERLPGIESVKTGVLDKVEIDGKTVTNVYLDVTTYAVVLATTGANGKVEKVELNPNQPMYKCVRMPVVEYSGDKIDDKMHINIQRIRVLKECVEHSDDEKFYEQCDIDPIELETEYAYVIIGQDFVVTMDKDYEIRYDIVPGDERAELELQEALKKVEEMKQQFTTGLGGMVND